MKRYVFTRDILSLGRKFSDSGHKLYIVGGAVRDFLLGRENHDYDFTTDATPEEVTALFPSSTIPTGIKHGTVTVLYRKEAYEITREEDFDMIDKSIRGEVPDERLTFFLDLIEVYIG